MMRKIFVGLLSVLSLAAQASAYQELGQYVRKTYGEQSEIYWRTMLIMREFEKEARDKLPEIAYELQQANPDLVIQFSNANCSVQSSDYMSFCTYIFTTHVPQYTAKGIVESEEAKHIFCPVPMSIDFKRAVNYTYDNVYVPAVKAGKEPNLLNYPPAGDPTKNAITYLQECLK